MRALRMTRMNILIPRGQMAQLTRRLGRDTLKDIVHKRVEDGHCLVRNTRIRVDLLED